MGTVIGGLVMISLTLTVESNNEGSLVVCVKPAGDEYGFRSISLMTPSSAPCLTTGSMLMIFLAISSMAWEIGASSSMLITGLLIQSLTNMASPFSKHHGCNPTP